MRFAVAGFSHEANTFASVKADLDVWRAQGILEWGRIRDNHATAASIVAGYIRYEAEAADVELVPLVHSKIMATGISTSEAFEYLCDSIIRELRAGAPWDGVLLAQHGAAVSEEFLDADGEFVRRVREALGPDVPIGVTLDLHANVSDLLLESADVITVYQTNPHIDALEQGLACGHLLGRMARGEIRPTMAIARPPLAINIRRQGTDEEPMAGIMAVAREQEEREGVLSVSVVEGFPYADVPAMGMSVIAMTDNDPLRAEAVAVAVADLMWARREEMRDDSPSPDEALLEAAAVAHGPVVLFDMGDNVGGGAPGDSTLLLHAARRLGLAAVESLSDPDAVADCQRAGVGGRVSITVGGRTDSRHGEPFPIEGEVIALSDGRFEDPSPTHGGFRFFDVGATAGIRTDDGFLLAVHSRPAGSFSRVQFEIAGIDPEEAGIILAKGVHSPRAAFEPIASRLIWANTRGASSADLSTFEYEHRTRPMFPFEPEAEWPSR